MSDEVHAPDDRPATFSDVFASREFRAIYAAGALSWFGDYLAKAAVTAMVYERTQSVAVAAATFALTYVPWVLGGTLLSTLADRYPYRRVMVVCDLVRMVLIALVALPQRPDIKLILVLLFLTALVSPPGQAAKAALLPLILTKDRLVVGLAVNTTTGQAAQVTGYLAGAAIAPFHPRLALLIDAVTFGLSALLIRLGVRNHPPVSSGQPRRHLVRETGDGIRLVFGTPVLRAIALLVFASMLFAIVPEGLAAAWADDVSHTSAERGVSQGLIMAASPVGFIVGGLLISRLVRPLRRQALIRPLAILSPL
ncbi:MAG TPA: MFS transporter, partial [Pilimelia sp.]|nr:MFS transporter [Pilimelia sp.]